MLQKSQYQKRVALNLEELTIIKNRANKVNRTTKKFRDFHENVNHKSRILGLAVKKFKITYKIFKRRELFELLTE